MGQTQLKPSRNSPKHVLFASLIGTTIEFFDFYIYATAAVLVFPQLFFPASDAATLQSLATFALAFFARPIGSAVFGHFGDRIGRKATLVAALLTMGLSTVCIGLLPTYETIGVTAPLLLALCRFGQGLGLGGEWGGAVLLATENAPPGKRSWYGMFPQFGAPLGFLCSTGIFLLLGNWTNDEQFFKWGWRVPFLASSLLVFVGLYVRLNLEETPAFKQAIDKHERVKLPIVTVIREYPLTLLLGTCSAIATFVVFYLMTVFALGWGTDALRIPRQEFLVLQMIGVLFFGLTIPLSAKLADKFTARGMLMAAALIVVVFGLFFAPIFGTGSKTQVLIFLCLGLGLMGLTYGPIGASLSEMFPTAVRYTGSSMTFNLGGILGGSFAPYIAKYLGDHYGLEFVGYYMSAAGLLTFVALWMYRERAE